jgi:outer membrane receptor protein involved in Fe transport
MWRRIVLAAFFCQLSVAVYASIFGSVKGLVHDPQHRPVVAARVIIRAANSDWKMAVVTGDSGEFQAQNVPAGDYLLSVEAPGFDASTTPARVTSGTVAELHIQLALATVHESVNVTDQVDTSSSPAVQTTVSRAEILTTPGADTTNSLAAITDFVPGAYIVHDQLHVRGGHQVTWAIDGVPVPNTNIASNVGPQFDPQDIDYLEVKRAGLSPEFGDRTYGVFNVITRSGFEFHNEADLITSYGSFNSTDNLLSFGSHTDRFAYYGSLNGNRTDLGLETPAPAVLHDRANGFGGFTSLIWNASPNDQLRFAGSAREDHFQVPNDPDAEAALISDRERERDAFANFSWIHSWNQGLTFTLSPFYHFNRAAFEGGPNDVPGVTDNRGSIYAGGQTTIQWLGKDQNVTAGIYTFVQHDSHLFGLNANDGSGEAFSQRLKPLGALEAFFVGDEFRATSWLTLTGGVRVTHFSGLTEENAATPRAGVALRIPKLNWVLRASYDRFYQAPPLETLSGPLLEFALQQWVGFLPLHGERDEQHDFGLTIPLRGWTGEVDYFRTGARNFFDHDVIGGSNIFFPLAIDRVRIRGLETTVRSPRLKGRIDLHLAYSHQRAEGFGAVSGGLTDFSPPPDGFFYLDHDQRNTLSVGASATLFWKTWLGANFNYGSGFLNGDGPGHLPSYRTLDLTVGRSFGERWSAKVTATNLTNKRYYIDLSNTFGGSHFANPREVSLQVRYRFHY